MIPFPPISHIKRVCIESFAHITSYIRRFAQKGKKKSIAQKEHTFFIMLS
jgi:hypothetical protein